VAIALLQLEMSMQQIRSTIVDSATTETLRAQGADVGELLAWLDSAADYLVELVGNTSVLPPIALQREETECLFCAAVPAYDRKNAVTIRIASQQHAISETPFAGIWCRQNAYGWLIEVGTIPASLYSQIEALPEMPAVLPQQTHNSEARAWLVNLRRAVQAVGRKGGSRVFNLTHEPLSESARQEIAAVLGEGEVRLSASEWGHGELQSTAWQHVWRGLYRDEAGGLVLETVEVCAIPDLILPSELDLRRSAAQLRRFAASLK
jgi:hypothetical protein